MDVIMSNYSLVLKVGVHENLHWVTSQVRVVHLNLFCLPLSSWSGDWYSTRHVCVISAQLSSFIGSSLFFLSGSVSEDLQSLSCFSQCSMKDVRLRSNKACSHGGNECFKKRSRGLKSTDFHNWGSDLPPLEKGIHCLLGCSVVWRVKGCELFGQNIAEPAVCAAALKSRMRGENIHLKKENFHLKHTILHLEHSFWNVKMTETHN